MRVDFKNPPAAATLVAAMMALSTAGVEAGNGKGPPAGKGPGAAQGQANVQSIVDGEVLRTEYGPDNDLLTAGLGVAGLEQGAPAPAISDPPTAAELRRLAIFNNYQALVDSTPDGGFGRLFGPNVAPDGTLLEDPRVPGVEYLAYAGKRSTPERVTMMVQIPESFDPAAPCVVTGASSGSRGVYGAIGTSGEWGLRRGCAVAYTDKGTGTGAHDLQDDTVSLITGERVDAGEAGRDSNFTVKLGQGARERFNAESPHRFAFKHAHSRTNPEARWGLHVLQSIEFAFWALNQEFPDAGIQPDNTIVIASSVSNGAGAAILAAEQDRKGLIDGVAVSEPNVNPEPGGDFAIQQGAQDPFFEHSKSLLDYTTLLNVYQPCASLANPAAPFNLLALVGDTIQENRCAALHELGLLQADTLAAQAAEAQQVINDFGFLEAQNIVQPSHYAVFVPQAIAVTYANAYAQARFDERLCGYSFGATQGSQFLPDVDNPETGEPIALDAATEAVLFGTSNGIPPTGGVNLINEDAQDGPRETRASKDPVTGLRDHNLAGALCTRGLATGLDPVTGQPLKGRLRRHAEKIAENIADIRASGDLLGKPAIVVTGRSDAIIPPNHGSRAYFGLNKSTQGSSSKLRYVEVVNAQHLDTFNADPGFASRFVPLHHYFLEGLDRMFAHLKDGEPLPPSQVVRGVPRGTENGEVPPLEQANLPAIQASPGADAIVFDGSIVRIPE